MSVYADSIKIVEVGPRDGLQNEKQILSVADRIEFITRLIGAGHKFLEAGSFVSPKAIPQLQDSEKVWEGLSKFDEIDLSFLVPNDKGLERALEVKVKSISVFTATSDTFNQKNIGMTVDESLDVLRKLVPTALQKGLKVRGYISTAFGCPYEGAQAPVKLYKILRELLSFGCYEVSVGDTIGSAHPQQVHDVFNDIQSEFGLDRIAGHFHDTRGAALVNIKTALDLGLRVVDASVGGLGGCPYAAGSSGNVATEEVVWLVEGLGFRTGIDLPKLLEAAEWVEKKIGRTLKSKLFLARK